MPRNNLPVCLSTAYLAPVQYFSRMLSAPLVLIEREEHYVKQTYRNRCHIASANGVLPLSIPVEKPDGKCLTRDVRISRHADWQTLHWRAIFSAYGSTPFFEYYQDDFRPFFEKNWTFLFDFNTQIQQKVLELLDVEVDIRFTETFRRTLPDADDLREAISPRRQPSDARFAPVPYYQVFGGKFGFLPNLSIIDLLFNMGPESPLVLRRTAI